MDEVYLIRVFTALLIALAAAYDDIKRYRISNRIIIAGLIMAVLVNIYGVMHKEDVCSYVSSGVVTFFIMFITCRLRAVGAGDVKLSGVLGLMLGAGAMFKVIVCAFAGTAVAGIVLIMANKCRRVSMQIGPGRTRCTLHTVHFGVALLFGVMVVMCCYVTGVI